MKPKLFTYGHNSPQWTGFLRHFEDAYFNEFSKTYEVHDRYDKNPIPEIINLTRNYRRVASIKKGFFFYGDTGLTRYPKAARRWILAYWFYFDLLNYAKWNPKLSACLPMIKNRLARISLRYQEAIRKQSSP